MTERVIEDRRPRFFAGVPVDALQGAHASIPAGGTREFFAHPMFPIAVVALRMRGPEWLRLRAARIGTRNLDAGVGLGIQLDPAGFVWRFERHTATPSIPLFVTIENVSGAALWVSEAVWWGRELKPGESWA